MNVLLSILMVSTLQQSNAATCGSEVVTWPVGITQNNCGAQLIYNGGAKVGASSSPLMSPVNGGEANFVCTTQGWQYVSGVCYPNRNLDCINAKLVRIFDGEGKMTADEVREVLDGVDSPLRTTLVDVVNACDAK